MKARLNCFTLAVRAVHALPLKTGESGKNRKGTFLVAEKWAGGIFCCRKLGRAHFGHQKNGQGAVPF